MSDSPAGLSVGGTLVAPADPSPGPEVVAPGPRLGALVSYLEQLVDGGFPPAVSLALLSPEAVLFEAYGGSACVIDEIVPVSAGTRYDLASLTKVVCSVNLLLLAEERGLLRLDDPLTDLLPAYPTRATTLRHLVTHTSGLIDHRPFFEQLDGRAAIERAVYDEAAGSRPGTSVCYSDLNFMLVGWALEAAFSTPLDEVFAAELAAPLGLQGTGFRPAPELRRQTAATELDGDQRRQPELVWGEVHDGNAFALGGVAGHAGLFAPLGELAQVVQVLLRGGEGVLSAGSVAALSVRQAGSGDDVRSFGWRLEPQDWGSWPAGTFFHTGFTGTSLLVAPEAGVAVVLLTNAVHPRRRLEEQRVMRAEVHRLVAEALS